MTKAEDILDIVSGQTDSIVLFHSLSGKDSIALMEMCYPRFKRIVCCFMYIVPNLRHLSPYVYYLRSRYKGVELIQTKHYSLYDYEKYGILGAEKTDTRQWRQRDIVRMVCESVGIEWSVTGFKKTDSLQRRLMLGGYTDGIEWKMKKAYPLSDYTNKEVLEYIREHNLKTPENYGDKGRSIGTDITSPIYLGWLKENYPDDLAKVYEAFPLCRTLIE